MAIGDSIHERSPARCRQSWTKAAGIYKDRPASIDAVRVRVLKA
jgi:hypothetical protein